MKRLRILIPGASVVLLSLGGILVYAGARFPEAFGETILSSDLAATLESWQESPPTPGDIAAAHDEWIVRYVSSRDMMSTIQWWCAGIAFIQLLCGAALASSSFSLFRLATPDRVPADHELDRSENRD